MQAGHGNRETNSLQNINELNESLDASSVRESTGTKEKTCKLNECEYIDQRYFWYMVNKSKKKVNKLQPIQNDKGQLLTNPDEIRNEWTIYHKNLYKGCAYDSAFKSRVDTEADKLYNCFPETK